MQLETTKLRVSLDFDENQPMCEISVATRFPTERQTTITMTARTKWGKKMVGGFASFLCMTSWGWMNQAAIDQKMVGGVKLRWLEQRKRIFCWKVSRIWCKPCVPSALWHIAKQYIYATSIRTGIIDMLYFAVKRWGKRGKHQRTAEWISSGKLQRATWRICSWTFTSAIHSL